MFVIVIYDRNGRLQFGAQVALVIYNPRALTTIIVYCTGITIVNYTLHNYDRKTFIVQATGLIFEGNFTSLPFRGSTWKGSNHRKHIRHTKNAHWS
jgi:hypothetical protein